MAYRSDERWAESRLDRQDSIAADGWSKRSDFEDTEHERQPRVRSKSKRSPWLAPLLIGGALIVGATAYRWMVG